MHCNCPNCATYNYHETLPEPPKAEAVQCSALVLLLARWREREADYKSEWREASARGHRGTADRLAAADIRAEVACCISELEDLIGAGKKENEKIRSGTGNAAPKQH